ncbi:autophagy protein ATG9 [Sporobolomyces salmoneus]|uniref:autophagy protein ATG9 n=1 Tax=Sporobolomyces salmoneus TaxID=183962 RepID=UPI003172924A
MPFSQTLSSIFLPSTSIYASIDQDQSNERTHHHHQHSSSRPSPSSTTRPASEADAAHTDTEEVVDPFATESTALPPPPTSSIPNHQLESDDPYAIHEEQEEIGQEDPFHNDLDQPSHHSHQRADGGGGGEETPTIATTLSSRERDREKGVGMIGSKSLMGLLGGTTYQSQSPSETSRAEGGDERFGTSQTGRQEREELNGSESVQGQTTIRNPGLADSAARSSISPPAGRRSRSDTTDDPYSQQDDEEEEEEEEDDLPPDFTTRIPLLSSTSHLSPSSLDPSRKPPRSSHRLAHPAILSPSSAASSNPLSRSRDSSSSSLGHSPRPRPRKRPSSVKNQMNARERALWNWINVEDLDGFLERVYRYYLGKGIWTIVLERVLNLLTVGWVIGFSTFLSSCVDYKKLWKAERLSNAVVEKCVSRLSGFSFLAFVLFVGFYAWRVAEFGLEVRKLWEMHEFYTELLEVPEDDIQSIPWSSIVNRLAHLRSTHPSSLSSNSTSRDSSETLDAHSVANRIMRSQNYLIALLNAPSTLDFSLPLPQIGIVRKYLGKDGRFGQGWLTKALEWNLKWTVLGFGFDEKGRVREMVLKEKKREELIKALRNRFILVGLLNAVFAPFIVVYLLIYSFFRYFEGRPEYHKNPSTLSSRQFTPLAIYKFRSFNELEHEFLLRLSTIRPLANLYLSSYPRAKTALVSRFIAFLAGSFAAVLIVFSILDPDAFLHFEVTPGRTVLFWIGILGGIVAVARGMNPNREEGGGGQAGMRGREEPGELMREIVELARYCPEEWEGKLHAYSVHQSFAPLFPPKPLLFLQELSSVLLTPLILIFTLPNCAGNVVDFFREFTIEVEGLGRVCSYAVFDLKNDGARRPSNTANPTANKRIDPRSRQTSSLAPHRFRQMENKMEKSLLNFAVSNPDWQPRDEAQSLFLSQMLSTDHHQPPLLPSAIHLPHQQHQQHSLLKSPPPTRSNSNARYPQSREESSNLALRHRRAAEKSRLYDRAFQRSTLLHASTTTSRRGGGNGKHGTGRIEEESHLDGESFVAMTEEEPFGLVVEEEEEEDRRVHEERRMEMGADGRRREGGKERLMESGLGALVGELYRR